jgi:hypothetical protein
MSSLAHLVRHEVSLLCLACGDTGELVVADLRQLPRLPRACTRCGSSVLATGAAVRRLLDLSQPLDMGTSPRARLPPVAFVPTRRLLTRLRPGCAPIPHLISGDLAGSPEPTR